jgi:hypothetical protein
MGVMQHHAIVVTSWDIEKLKIVLAKAVEIGCHTTPIVEGRINTVGTFVVTPDGSKEGWSDSDDGDAERAALIEFIGTLAYEDRSNAIEFVEISYGELGVAIKATNLRDRHR